MPEEPKEEVAEKRAEKGTKYMVLTVLGLIIILAVIILGIQHLSQQNLIDKTLGGDESETRYVYNGFVFIYQEGLWNTRWQRGNEEYSIHFHYGPKDVELIPVIGGFGPETNFSEYYITFNPTAKNLSMVGLASAQIALSLTKVFDTQIIVACDRNETEACTTRPIITCSSDVKDHPIIYLKPEGERLINISNNCMIIQGQGTGVLESADKVLYNFYGIIPFERE